MNYRTRKVDVDDILFRARFGRRYQFEYNGAVPANFTSLDFVGALGSVGTALLYSKLFWPDFIEVDGMVFLKDLAADYGGPDEIRRMFIDLGNRQSVEMEINNFDVNLSFPNHPEENADGDGLLLAGLLAEIWSLRLQQLFNLRKFRVEVNEDDGSPCVFFFEEREGTGPGYRLPKA